MNWQIYLYQVRETINHIGVGKIILFALILIFGIWLIWPETKKSSVNNGEISKYNTQPPSNHQSSKTSVDNKLIYNEEGAVLSDVDLRAIMTSKQSSFYWVSFEWMMQYGKDLQPKNFSNSVMSITYIADKAFQAHNMTCRPYSEKIVMAGKINIRKGVACKNKSGNWCRQIEGEPAICRNKLDNNKIITNNSIKWHNLKMGWDRNLAKIPF